MRAAILRDDRPDNSKKWELACEKLGLDYLPINMLRSNSLHVLEDFQPDFCLCRPPGDLSANKEIFDKKLYMIEKERGVPCFPGYHETLIYENKAALAWFLEVNDIPHPVIFVSADKQEAYEFADNSEYPFFAKTLIGAAGSGVKRINSQTEAMDYIDKAFSTGIKRRYGPNRKTGSPATWLKKAIQSPSYLMKKLKLYSRSRGEVQKNIVVFQQYVEHEFEWRIVRIGESWFGYKKLKIDDMASGAKQFEYGTVPEKLLTFTRNLCDTHNFQFMAADLFYDGDQVLVNELQTIFGHKSEAITYVNGKPGRYLWKDENWIFEEGMFNGNESYDLRLKTAIDLYKKDKL